MNVKWTKTMVDKLVDMYTNGEPIDNIAKAVRASKWGCYEKLKSLGVLSGERLLKQECQYCGAPFMTKANSRKLYCSEKCRRAAKNKRRLAKDQTELIKRRTHPYPLIREYTDTSDMLIAQCLMEGYSIEEIANLLGRNAQDLKQHIKEAYKNIKLWRKRILQQWGVKTYMRFIEARRRQREAQASAGV